MEEDNQNRISGTNSDSEEVFQTPSTNINMKNTYIISHSDSLELKDKDSKLHLLTSEDGNVSDKNNCLTFGQPCRVEINDTANPEVAMSVLSLYEIEQGSLLDAEKLVG